MASGSPEGTAGQAANRVSIASNLDQGDGSSSSRDDREPDKGFLGLRHPAFQATSGFPPVRPALPDPPDRLCPDVPDRVHAPARLDVAVGLDLDHCQRRAQGPVVGGMTLSEDEQRFGVAEVGNHHLELMYGIRDR